MNLEELERLAREATPGPWVSRRGFVMQPPEGMWETIIADTANGIESENWAKEFVQNGEFIAAANPATVLALIARIREWEADDCPACRSDLNEIASVHAQRHVGRISPRVTF